jgi:diguanylate cyclase (GGDEF)-like protein/PAS domain S-box-containing protein
VTDAVPGGDDAGLDLPSRAFDLITDCVVALDGLGNVIGVNPFMLRLLGYERDEVVGRSIAEFVHPDDLERAIRVMAMVTTDTLDVPITPALYRVRRSDGAWLPIEMNGSRVPGAAPDDDTMVIIGRYSADRDLQDQMMARLVHGESPTAVIELVPQLGHWRHLMDHYAVIFTDERGRPAIAGTDSMVGLIDAETLVDPATPWARAMLEHAEELCAVEDLPSDLATRAAAMGLGPCWVTPVVDPMRELGAAILVWCRADGPDVEVHRYAVETMARAMEVILQWRHQVTNLVDAARRDPLTGLVNRTGFWEVLDALARDQASPLVAVLYVDLDGFKEVNDRYGHRAGDHVLTEAAQRIATVIRPGDTVARLGGDEFAIVCRDLGARREAIAIAERVLSSLTAPIRPDGVELDADIEVGASVGIAAVPGHALRSDELLEAADAALYQAKREGRGSWHLAGATGEDTGSLQA